MDIFILWLIIGYFLIAWILYLYFQWLKSDSGKMYMKFKSENLKIKRKLEMIEKILKEKI